MAITLLLLYLLTGTQLRELFKFPVLVQHYQEHKQNDKDLNFFSFLYMHYAGDDNNTQDQDRDMQLPFKSCEDPSTVHLVLVPVQHIQLSIKPATGSNITIQTAQNIHSFYETSIWQPPKIRFI